MLRSDVSMTRSAASRVPCSSCRSSSIDSSRPSVVRGERVLAPRRRRSAARARRPRVEEQHGHPVAGRPATRRRCRARCRGCGRRRARGARCRCPGPTPARRSSHERRRQVVDDVPPEVLEHVGGRRPPCAGHAGDEDDLGHRGRLPSGRRAARGRFTRVGRPQVQQPGTVAASSYSAARARNPAGGAGSTIR